MRHLVISFLSILCLPAFLFAEEAIVAQYRYLMGSYVCVGRWPDSNKTFSGRVEIGEANEGVKIIRMIDGQRIEGVGKYGSITPDEIRVLKIIFTQEGKAYEETCLVSGDLDNYARITCYLYAEKTKKVGLEALFSDHGQLVKE